jgi:pimeloyl-ACP methyl ester carboxylesterase
MESRSRYLRLLGRELHVLEWGAGTAPPLVLWHGLARTGRDFDDLAAVLAETHRVPRYDRARVLGVESGPGR